MPTQKSNTFNKSLKFIKKKEESSIRFSLVNSAHHDTPASYAEFLEHLETDEHFRTLLTDTIANAGSNFYWECVPVSFSTLSTTNFEFVLTPRATSKPANPDAFSNQFALSKNEKTISFKNAKGDADLVVPTPLQGGEQKHFSHLTSFLNDASQEQKDNLWQKVAITLKNRLKTKENEPVWMSTHGDGVYWLHIRLDQAPKYYHFNKFKTFHTTNNVFHAVEIVAEASSSTTHANTSVMKNKHQIPETARENTSPKESLSFFFRYPKAMAAVAAGIACFIIAAALLATGGPFIAITGCSIVGLGACAYAFFTSANKQPLSTTHTEKLLVGQHTNAM